MRELYQWPGVRETVNLKHIKVGYYTNPAINSTLIVPRGPVLDLDRAHDRERLAGRGVWRRSVAGVHSMAASSSGQYRPALPVLR